MPIKSQSTLAASATGALSRGNNELGTRTFEFRARDRILNVRLVFFTDRILLLLFDKTLGRPGTWIESIPTDQYKRKKEKVVDGKLRARRFNYKILLGQREDDSEWLPLVDSLSATVSDHLVSGSVRPLVIGLGLVDYSRDAIGAIAKEFDEAYVK